MEPGLPSKFCVARSNIGVSALPSVPIGLSVPVAVSVPLGASTGLVTSGIGVNPSLGARGLGDFA